MLHPWGRRSILTLFDLSYRVFEPFFQLRGHLYFPFPKGNSPLDFIVQTAGVR
jgi:hypothetical protein